MIVPVFNGEPFIMQFFNSIRIDIAKHGIEIIFVDNGSIDKTNEMLVNLSKPHKNIRVLKYEDKQNSMLLEMKEQEMQEEIFFYLPI